MINSDIKEKFNIWGRDFDLDVSFICYDDEEVLDNQIKIFKKIKEESNYYYEVCKFKIYEYVQEEIEKFPDNLIPENVFKFIIPKAIIIDRNVDYDYYGFLFYYRYDRDNDICVSFKNNDFYEIGPEDIIL